MDTGFGSLTTRLCGGGAYYYRDCDSSAFCSGFVFLFAGLITLLGLSGLWQALRTLVIWTPPSCLAEVAADL